MRRALYREYRPTKLKDVVGQDAVVQALAGAVKKGKISHAYLFIGPRGCGKTSVARIFAHAVNGFDYELEDSYVDIIEIDAASNTGVDNIRELREKAVITPTLGKYKIYIIDEVHMLSKSAFNALLKILEEPPAHVIFIMATTDPQKIPVTITSRAQTYTFRLAPPDVMKNYLATVAKKENLDVDSAALKIIARRGGGSFRDSLSLLDQLSTLADGKITAETVESALGLPADEVVKDLLDAYAAGDVVKITTLLQDLLNSGLKPETVAEDLVVRLVADPRPELLPLLEKLPTVTGNFPEAKLLLAFLYEPGAARSVRGTFPDSSSAAGSARGTSSDNLGAAGRAGGTFPPAETTTSIPDGPDGFARRAVPPATQRMTSSTPTGVPPARPAAPLNWPDFLTAVTEKSSGLANILKKCTHTLDAGTLRLYIASPTYQKILTSKHNHDLLTSLSGHAIVVAEKPNENPAEEAGKTPDSPISQISDIMGGVEEVNEQNGNPFA